MKTKTCFKCKIEQEIDNFYRHSKMGDGHLGKCKSCTKKDAKEDYERKIKDPDFLENERVRGREKYKRLEYLKQHRVAKLVKPWKSNSIYVNQSRRYGLPRNMDLHHWNYNNEYLKDVIPMEIKNHRRAHKKMILDLDKRIFKTLTGEYLDTKEKHLEYIAQFIDTQELF